MSAGVPWDVSENVSVVNRIRPIPYQMAFIKMALVIKEMSVGV